MKQFVITAVSGHDPKTGFHQRSQPIIVGMVSTPSLQDISRGYDIIESIDPVRRIREFWSQKYLTDKVDYYAVYVLGEHEVLEIIRTEDITEGV